MKMEVSGDGQVVFKEVYNPIGLETRDGEKLSICMRDSGFEFRYQGVLYSAKEGVVKEMKVSDRGNVLVDQSDKGEDEDEVKEGPGYQMWEELYGKKVSMGDRMESEHIWSEELAHKNHGRWTPEEMK